MKKFLIMFALMVGIVSANAQTALQESKLTDNVSVGVNAGVATPLSFNKMFPLNTTVGIRIGKEFSPVFGVNIEGTTWLGSNDRQWFIDGFQTANAVERIRTSNRFDVPDENGVFHNTFRGINVGLNGTVNLTNLFLGYNGAPRSFELVTVTGLGWGHVFAPKSIGADKDNLTARTAIDFTFNLGKSKATSLYVEPAVLWNLNGNGFDGVQFNKNRAQLAISVGFVYRFKTSNGTHNFKKWDVGAILNENDVLKAKLDECEKRGPKVIEKIVKVPVDAATVRNGNDVWVVTFATGSSSLTKEAKYILNQVGDNIVVDVTATASPDGTAEFNQRLSERRAAVVADFLTNRGVKVNSFIGKGVNAETGRSAIVKPTK